MTETTGRVERLEGALEALRTALDELRRRVAVSDEGRTLCQVKADGNKSRWYREPSVLIAALALAVSVGTFVVGQVNIISDRRIQDRNQLSALIERLPTVFAQVRTDPDGSGADLLFLVSGGAAALMDKLGPDASTAYEKIAVAAALSAAADLPTAKRLAIEAVRQSTNAPQKIAAGHTIADIDFQAGDFAGGRAAYQEDINLLQAPQSELDSPLLRGRQTIHEELLWANHEFSYAKSCQNAIEQLRNAKRILDQLPTGQVTADAAQLENSTKNVAADCPAAIR